MIWHPQAEFSLNSKTNIDLITEFSQKLIVWIQEFSVVRTSQPKTLIFTIKTIDI